VVFAGTGNLEVTALALKAAPSDYVASLFKLQGGERTS